MNFCVECYNVDHTHHNCKTKTDHSPMRNVISGTDKIEEQNNILRILQKYFPKFQIIVDGICRPYQLKIFTPEEGKSYWTSLQILGKRPKTENDTMPFYMRFTINPDSLKYSWSSKYTSICEILDENTNEYISINKCPCSICMTQHGDFVNYMHSKPMCKSCSLKDKFSFQEVEWEIFKPKFSEQNTLDGMSDVDKKILASRVIKYYCIDYFVHEDKNYKIPEIHNIRKKNESDVKKIIHTCDKMTEIRENCYTIDTTTELYDEKTDHYIAFKNLKSKFFNPNGYCIIRYACTDSDYERDDEYDSDY